MCYSCREEKIESKLKAEKPKVVPVHLKDLMNDLERSEQIKERVQMQLKQKIDQPRQLGMNSSGITMSTSTWMSSFAGYRRW
jgi:hypothetical protein